MRPRLLIALACALILASPAVHAEDAKKKGGGPSYIQLDPLTATIIRGDGHRGALTVETGVDIPDDPGLHARAVASQPRLRAAYLIVLQAYASGLAPGAPPDADYLSHVLQRETDSVLGKPGARVLLGTMLAN